MYVAVVISDKDIQEDKKIMFDNKPPQERLRQQAIKDAEKERAQFYAKQKEGQKDVRAKYREKVRAVWFGLGKNREGPNHNV